MIPSAARFPFVRRPHTKRHLQILVSMTDFGVVDDSVALCKGVMYSIALTLCALWT